MIVIPICNKEPTGESRWALFIKDMFGSHSGTESPGRGNDMAAKILTFVLRGTGLLMLTALIAVGMPFAWMLS